MKRRKIASRHSRSLSNGVGRFAGLIARKSDHLGANLIKSIFTSLLAFGLDMGLLVILVEGAGVYYLAANSISFLAGCSLSYLLSVALVFHTRAVKNKRIEYAAFIFIGVIGVALNSALLWLFTSVAGIFYLYSKIIAGSTVFFWNFFARKYLLFHMKNRGESRSNS